jgi:ComF family protein
MKLFDDFISLIFPRICAACGELFFKNEEIICTKCLYKLPKTNFHCFADNPVMQIFWGRIELHSAAAFLNFTKSGRVQRLVHQLKYKSKTEVGILLGELYGRDLKKAVLFQTVDIVVPVPLHWKKQKKRGFNQSEMFGRGLAKSMNAKLDINTLSRRVDTETQTKKSKAERWENVRDVFELTNPAHFEGKHILLVDDVITTGATMEASANTLLTIPGVKVSVATIAFASK